ncbi:cupin domain-containing protein [Aspergillus mulundensis]|uniref:Cupin 2 conserved barrel domain-containing protein n=1 Tax=Aspergillus mulundensis TaxID=1810919 RepID=A0A3D8R9L8_9EURO|nr:Uncharacterized protein DSM5745_08065 [Aspergillus mulundensis]RDW70554.1 Uncharacterized protein DSM5745_08065 [Aspergillus mulundensis]
MPESSLSPAPLLPPPRRIVTGHTPTGLATVTHDTTVPPQPIGNGPHIALLWHSTTHPATINDATDQGPGAVTGMPPSGSALSAYDIPPKSEGVFHRSITLDYVIVAKGCVVLRLDDGSAVRLNEGDVVVQRATMHSWCNEGESWARVFGIMMPAEKPVVGGDGGGGEGRELEAVWPF